MTLPIVKLTSSTTQASAPFFTGQVFKKGDVPSGSQVVSNVTNFQCVPINTWPDGSLRFASLAGNLPLTGGATFDMQLSIGTPSAATALTLADLKATGIVANATLTGGQDYTFDTAAQTVGARLSLSSPDDEIQSNAGITVDNNGVLSNKVFTPVGSNDIIMTASLSGGTVGGRQVVSYNLYFKPKRTITAITNATNARITTAQNWLSTDQTSGKDTFDNHFIDPGYTVTFSGISGMTQLNGMTGTITAIGSNREWIEVNIDTTGFSAYTSGGTAISNTVMRNYNTTQAYVRTGGGLEWDGTTMGYKSSNAIIGTTVCNWAGTDWDTPHKTWISGPEMSSWIYRKTVGNDSYLEVWLEVQLWKNGRYCVIPHVENGRAFVTAPTAKLGTWTFTLNGTQRYSGLLDIKHHQRPLLMDGAKTEHWDNPSTVQVIPRLDVDYMMLTEMVPTYATRVPAYDINNPYINATPSNHDYLVDNYTPLDYKNFKYENNNMAVGGFHGPIGVLPTHDVAYLVGTTQPDLLYKSVVQNGYTAGTYGIHFRDETDGYSPMRITKYEQLGLTGGNDHGLKDVGGNGGYTPEPTGGSAPAWDPAHHPSVGYMAYLLTARFFFKEELQFSVSTNHFIVTYWIREGGLHDPNNHNPYPGITTPSSLMVSYPQTRTGSWKTRTLFQAVASVPDSGDPWRADLIKCVEDNITYFTAEFITKTYNNPFGMVTDYGGYFDVSSTDMLTAAWQQDWSTAAWGMGLAMDPPISSGNKAKMRDFFNWKARSVVHRFGTSAAGGWPYEHACFYEYAYCPGRNPDVYGGTGPWFPNSGAAYAASHVGSQNVPLVPNELYIAGDYNAPHLGVWADMHPALAYAKRHGVRGADAAWTRLTGASNYHIMTDGFTTDNAVWGVVPSLNTTVYNINPTDPGAPEVGGSTFTYLPGKSARTDDSPFFAGTAETGDDGLGQLAETIVSTVGPQGVSPLYESLESTDNGYEVRWYVKSGFAEGNLKLYEDGSASYTGPTTSGVVGFAKAGNEVFTETWNLTAASGSATVTSVTVTPSTFTVNGGATQQFSATVTGTNSPPQGIIWSVVGGGSINSSGLFTAPAATSSAQTITVTAQSSFDVSKSGTATVTVPAATGGQTPTVTSVSVSPSTANVTGGATQTFLAIVVGTNSPAQTVTWSTNAGSITSGGVFTAPAATNGAQTVIVTATSTVDGSKSGTATVTVPAVSGGGTSTVISVTVNPFNAILAGGGTQQLVATVTGTNSPSQSVTWSVVGGGSVSGSGLYTAPAVTSQSQTITVKATSVQDSSKFGTCVVTVPGVGSLVTGVTVNPASATTLGGSSQVFVGNVFGTNSVSQLVTWGTSAGTINSSGVFTAPSATSSVQTVNITCVSIQDGTKAGGATITVPALVSSSPTVTNVVLNNSQVSLFGSGTAQMSAVVTGTNYPSQTIAWTATIGTIDSNGVYTAPAANGFIQTGTIRGTSVTDPTKFATCSVTVASAPSITYGSFKIAFRSSFK